MSRPIIEARIYAIYRKSKTHCKYALEYLKHYEQGDAHRHTDAHEKHGLTFAAADKIQSVVREIVNREQAKQQRGS